MIEDNDLVATLMRTAGRRTMPPDSLCDSTFAAASAVLEQKLRKRRHRRRLLQIAALLLISVGVAGLVLRFAERAATGSAIAHVDRLIGTAELRAAAIGRSEPVDVGAELRRGSVLATSASSRVGILLANGTSLRLAPRTEIEFNSPTEVRLIDGTIYVDTGTDAHATPLLHVATAFGVTRDLGTRFEVRCSDEEYRLRVREGLVMLDRNQTELRSAAGEELTVDAHGEVARATIATHSPEWQWVMDVAPRPDLDGAVLSDFLDWIARETGREIRYSTPEIGDRVKITVLHGDVSGLAPIDALTVMLATTDFEHSIDDDGTIVISPRKTAPRRP